MSFKADLLKVIESHPEDDVPRLELADWYDSEGDSARAEFIRVQCEYARLDMDDPRRGPLHERQTLLLADHRDKWLPTGWSFPAYPPETWRRGFVSRLHKQEGRITREDGASLAALPLLEALSFAGTGANDTEFGHIPILPNLKEFSLWGGEELTNTSFARLAEWPALEILYLLSTGLTNDGFAFLSAIPGLRSLAVFDHHESEEITDEGLFHLAEMTNLTELILNIREVTGSGLGALNQLPCLRKLSLGGCGLTEEAIGPLVGCRNLEELKIDHYYGDGGVGDRLLGALPQLPSLRILHANRIDVTPEGYRSLSHLTDLEELSVASEFGDRELARLGGLQRLRRLCLRTNQISIAGLSRLADLSALRALDSSGMHLPPEAGKILGKLEKLSWLSLEVFTSDLLIDQIADLPNLEVLQIRNLRATPTDLRHLKRLPKLRRLSLDHFADDYAAIQKEFSWERRTEWAPHLESLSMQGHIYGPREWISLGWNRY